jgi:hypothetical protein
VQASAMETMFVIAGRSLFSAKLAILDDNKKLFSIFLFLRGKRIIFAYEISQSH